MNHSPDRVPGRRERAADLEHVVAQGRQARADPRAGPALDRILELVDLVVQRVNEIEVALRDVVNGW